MDTAPQDDYRETPVQKAAQGNAAHAFFFADGRLRPIWRFVIAVLVVAAANVLGGTLTYIVFRGHPLAMDAGYRAFTLTILVGAFSLMLRHLDDVEGDLMAAQGLGFQGHWLRNAAVGFAIGAVLVSLSVIAIAVWGHLEFTAKLNATAIRHTCTILVLVLAGAAFEEVMFRGYPFQRLLESIGAWGSILLLSIVFGVVHLDNPNAGGLCSWGFFNTIAVGVLLAIAYLKTGSLWLSIGFHIAWNFTLGVVYGLPVSGMKMFNTIVKTHASGPKLLTGGDYGIEASVTAAVVIVLGTAVLLLIPRRWLVAIPAKNNPVEPLPPGI